MQERAFLRILPAIPTPSFALSLKNMNRRWFRRLAPKPDPKLYPQPKKRFEGQPECWECAHSVIFTTPIYGMLRCALLPDLLPFGYHWAACIKFSPNRKVWKAERNG